MLESNVAKGRALKSARTRDTGTQGNRSLRRMSLG